MFYSTQIFYMFYSTQILLHILQYSNTVTHSILKYSYTFYSTQILVCKIVYTQILLNMASTHYAYTIIILVLSPNTVPLSFNMNATISKYWFIYYVS